MAAKHSTSAWKRTSLLVRTQAYANPDTRCRVCGLTLLERRRTHPRDGWDAGHPRPGQTGIAPEHTSCNRADGARLARNTQKRLAQTQQW